jgi:hypothetical protein
MPRILPGTTWEGLPDQKPLRLGATGHRVIGGTRRVRAGIRRALKTIQRAYPGRPLTVLSALAEGADRLIAEEVLRTPGAHLVAVLPFGQARYARDFGPAGSPSRAHFDALLERASEVHVMPPAASRTAGYAHAGRYVVDHSDVLLAVWDGQPKQGQGGTTDTVAYARAQGRPLLIVLAGNRKPGTLEPTTLGSRQGQLLVERLPLRSKRSPSQEVNRKRKTLLIDFENR